jgi:hypothetical protein
MTFCISLARAIEMGTRMHNEKTEKRCRMEQLKEKRAELLVDPSIRLVLPLNGGVFKP